MQTPIIVAHRAGNSHAALKRAVAERADWVEGDIWLRSGRLEARHERALWRLPLLYDKWKFVRVARPPLVVEELSAAVRNGPRLLLDLKGSGRRLPSILVETLQRLGAVGRTSICARDWSLLDTLAKLEPSLDLLYSFGSEKQILKLTRRRSSAPRITAASVDERLLTPATLADFERRGIAVIAWTVNCLQRAQDLIEQGVRGITTDQYDLLHEVRDQPLPSSAGADASGS